MTTATDRAGAGDRPGGSADITLRVAASTYVAAIAIYALLVAFSARDVLHDPTGDWRWTAVVLVLLGLFLIFFLGSLRLVVSGGVLRYHNLFGKRTLPLAEIVRTEFRRKLFARDPRPILLITSRNSAKKMQVNLMPFRRDDVARFLAIPELKIEKGQDV